MNIFVYMDEGVGPRAVRLLIKTLETLNLPPITRINSHDLTHKEWEKECSLLIFPGGRDIYYHQRLQGKANARIRSFVEKGGAYLGLCAGGYYGSGKIEFEKGHPLEVIEERELKFFPGLARGSAYGPKQFRYEDESGSCLAEIKWEADFSLDTVSTYFNGGCAFIDPHLYPNTRVLARYHNLSHSPAAIIECEVKQGKAILSGVHPEYTIHHLKEVRSTPKELIEQLESGEPLRKKLFSTLLSRLVN